MESPSPGISLPASTFVHLRAALTDVCGQRRAIQALQAAGFAAGESIAALLVTDAEAAAGTFWRRLGAHFEHSGWASLHHAAPHPGVEVLSSPDWPEADTATGGPGASCAFTTGLLSRILSTVASAPVSVLEIECRSRGDGRCAFAIGSEDTLHRLYGHLVEDGALDEVLG
ncbi:MAG: 4-vinyl reductase, partial [Gemmatimonadetes bacterium]|nr:4-vinyl reductase [Gemmatimonadota bacterium]